MGNGMFERLLSYKLIEDIEIDYRFANSRSSDRARRSSVSIAVIDDEPFKPEHNLRNVGYEIDCLSDIKSISEVEPYHIVLCDLQGVGKSLDSKSQGAFIIDEIKRNHPDKFVIAYTGGSLDSDITLRAQKYADYFLRKDADMDEWRDKLDEVIGLISNPIEVWRRQRVALVESNVNTLDILKLEDAYVRSVKAKSPEHYTRAAEMLKHGSDVRAIANSLIASGIFKILVGN